jgi:hypothetical protein
MVDVTVHFAYVAKTQWAATALLLDSGIGRFFTAVAAMFDRVIAGEIKLGQWYCLQFYKLFSDGSIEKDGPEVRSSRSQLRSPMLMRVPQN